LEFIELNFEGTVDMLKMGVSNVYPGNTYTP